MTTCECGCGTQLKPGRRYINGHNIRPCAPGQFNVAEAKAMALEKQRAITAAFLEDVEWMADTGESLEGTARRFALSCNTLQQRLQRWKRRDVESRLIRNGRLYGNPEVA